MAAIASVLWVLSACAGCGSAEPAPETTTTTASPVPAPAPAPAPDPSPSPAATPDGPCENVGDCTFCHWIVPSDPSACACPTCARVATTPSGCGEMMREHQRVCPHLQCRLPVCDAAPAVSTCIEGRCVSAPVVDSASGQPSPCRSPADCPGNLRCVVSALGGDIGCTNGTCCSAAECNNGCATDADCPSCRPQCRNGTCRTTTGGP
jgi:hypothetical protein